MNIHIDQAASGCVSGTLGEWPELAKALAEEGLRLPLDTDAITLKRICQLLVDTNTRRFVEHLEQASKTVSLWSMWKQTVLGK